MIDLLGLSLTIPIMANYAREVQGPTPGCPPIGMANITEYQRMYDTDECQQGLASIKANTGLLHTAHSVATLISTFWMPLFSDRYGPRLAIIVSIFGSLLGFLGQGLVCPTFETSPESTCIGIPGGLSLFVGVRFLGGLFGGTGTVASAFIVIMFPQRERARQFGRISAGAMSAFVFGPFIGGGMSQFGLRVPLFIASALSAVAMLAAIKFVVDPQKLVDARDKARGHALSLGERTEDHDSTAQEEMASDFQPHKSPRVWIMSMQACFKTIAFNGLTSLMSLVLLEERLGVIDSTDSVEVQGRKVALWVMALVPTLGGIQMPVIVAVFPRMVKKIGLMPTGIVGSLFIALGITLIPFWPAPAYLFIGQVIIAFGNGLQTNISNTYLAKFAPKGMAARTLAYGAIADTIGNIVGPQLTQIYLLDSVTPFIVAGAFGVLACLCCVVLYGMGENSPKSQDNRQDADAEAGASCVQLLEPQGKQADESVANKAENDAEWFTTSLDEKQPLATLMHPSCFRSIGLGPHGKGEPAGADQNKYFSIVAQELVDAYIETLKFCNHGYAMRSRVKKFRHRAILSEKDWVIMNMRLLRNPSDEDADEAFREDMAIFLSETGHADWAMTIPGIDLGGILQTLQVPR